jgi:hypothetical protein
MIVPLPQALLRTRRGENRRCCAAPENATASEINRGNAGDKRGRGGRSPEEAAHQKRAMQKWTLILLIDDAAGSDSDSGDDSDAASETTTSSSDEEDEILEYTPYPKILGM